MDLSPSDLLHAGAYRVCFERFNPDACITDQHLAGIDAAATKMLVWAQGQPDVIREAYQRAIQDVRGRAVTRFENEKRGMACVEAYKTIPKPPLD